MCVYIGVCGTFVAPKWRATSSSLLAPLLRGVCGLSESEAVGLWGCGAFARALWSFTA